MSNLNQGLESDRINVLDIEAQEYFSHNPDKTEVAFVMLEGSNLKDVRNDDSIYLNEDDIFYTVRKG